MGAFRQISDLRRERQGTAAVELGATLPFIIALIAGAVEYGRGFALQIDLEQAAQRAAELAISRPPADNTTAALAHIRTEAESVSGQPTGNVTVELYRDCNDVKKTPYGTACTAGQRSADYVKVAIQGTYTRIIDYRGFINGASSATPTVRGEATVRIR